MTKQTFDDMLEKLTKGQDSVRLSTTPDKLVDAIMGVVNGLAIDENKLTAFKVGLQSLFEGLQNNGKQ